MVHPTTERLILAACLVSGSGVRVLLFSQTVLAVLLVTGSGAEQTVAEMICLR